MTENYTRPPPQSPRRRGLPYNDGGAIGIIQKLRPDICKGRIFACGASESGGDEAWIEATPSTLVLKRNPDLSCGTEKRAIADLLGINLYFETSQVYQAGLPTVEELARRIIALKRKFPQTNAVLVKRDTETAPMLIRVHPKLLRVMVTEFAAHHFGIEEDIPMFYGVLPFGWGVARAISVDSAMRLPAYTNSMARPIFCGMRLRHSGQKCTLMTACLLS